MRVTVCRLCEYDIAKWERMRKALWSDVAADELDLEMSDPTGLALASATLRRSSLLE